MCDCDGPRAFHERVRKASKLHRCCECDGPIARGERYEYASGVWDDGANDFKTCLLCVEARKNYIAQLDRHDCWPCFGELYEGWAYEDMPEHAAAIRRGKMDRVLAGVAEISP